MNKTIKNRDLSDRHLIIKKVIKKLDHAASESRGDENYNPQLR